MLLQEFTGFDDVISVFVTSQPQNNLFRNLTKSCFNKQKILLLALTKQFFDKGGGGEICPPLPEQIGCENSPVDIGWNTDRFAESQ